MRISFNVNGQPVSVDVEPNELLADVLRERLDVTGVKKPCGTGDCGACTVLLDGEAVLSCLTLAAESDGCNIITVEGLSKGDELHPLQRAFVEDGAIQCGYCTPGMLMSAYALLLENPRPTEEEVRRTLEGNLCRCGTYQNVVKAVLRAGREMEEE